MADQFPVYKGNCPRNVSHDAKYSIRRRGNEWVVEMLYEAEDDERWHASTEDHPQLVELVNAVKEAVTGRPGGPFYINEYGQVIVPAGEGSVYYLAGEYEQPLRFIFEDNILSGEGVDLAGAPLTPGDRWEGPHHGIPYVLTAGAGDIYYWVEARPDVRKKVRLSRHVDPDALEALTDRIRAVKGADGGRIYINEWREMFVPLREGQDTDYIYVGHLELDDVWFPKP